MIILGIDPGTATTGFGVIRGIRGKKAKLVDYGCIKTEPRFSPGERLVTINKHLGKIIDLHQPSVIAIENLYFFKNLKTVMPVSQAKGVILFTAAKKKIPVYEFTPIQMKLIITGYGRSEKKEVQKAVKGLLNLKRKHQNRDQKKDDATDALGIALCYLLQTKKKLKINSI